MEGRDEQLQTLNDLVQNLADDFPNDCESIFRERCAAIKKHIDGIILEKCCEFKKTGEGESEMWRFWSMFTTKLCRC